MNYQVMNLGYQLMDPIEDIIDQHTMTDYQYQLAQLNKQYRESLKDIDAFKTEFPGIIPDYLIQDWKDKLALATKYQAEDIINNYIDPVSDAFKGSMTDLLALAPVQYEGMYTGAYQEYYQAAKTGGASEYQDLMSFLESTYLPFMKNYVGGTQDYSTIWDAVMSQIQPIEVRLEVDGKTLAKTIVHQAGAYPELAALLGLLNP
jgi:hypothetical protein